MKQILLFGAGKSATVLIDYLKIKASEKHWMVIVADMNPEAVQAKIGEHKWVKAVCLSIDNEIERKALIVKADVVISLLPPSLHYIVAMDCLAMRKHLLTASYVDEKIKLLENEIKQKGILFLYEMGLDPGIDHMSSMQLIHRIKSERGKITSFISHCGGLVAPNSDNNPWHYKISWNPKNVVMAGKSGAVYKENNEVVIKKYEAMFWNCSEVCIPELGRLAFYPNRDSIGYITTYELPEVKNFIRTTLRHPDFCKGWEKIVALGFTNETDMIDSEGLSISCFLQQAFARKKISFESELEKEQFIFLGWNDATFINKGRCSAAEILQFIIEKKWVLTKEDKDMVVMFHEIDYEMKGQYLQVKSSLVVEGENNIRTAMAKTVGLPLGIAATLILDGKITETGLCIPIVSGIYEPVLKVLEDYGIKFLETNS